MTRALILVLDSLGLGGAPDAAKFGDEGSDTLGHIVAACAEGAGDKKDLRSGPLRIPNLERLGLMAAHAVSQGDQIPGGRFDAAFGAAVEKSRGKDTPSGHWEMAGVPVDTDWGYFPGSQPCFPDALIAALIDEAALPGVLGNRRASGTKIIEDLGEKHERTGKPIVYTSADSVFQIAAHEDSFGLERLYEVCTIARRLVDDYRIGRVIARPFTGIAGAYTRTANRRDYATPPPAPTLLDRLFGSGGTVISVGKIADIFAHQGISETVKADGNERLFQATLDVLSRAADRTLIFSNFVDFDTLFGHRRDVAGYAAALEAFDVRVPDLERALRPSDLAVFTADHGCDPTWSGTDHTRENVPVLAIGGGIAPGSIGLRDGFADIGQTIGAHLGLAPLEHGVSFTRKAAA